MKDGYQIGIQSTSKYLYDFDLSIFYGQIEENQQLNVKNETYDLVHSQIFINNKSRLLCDHSSNNSILSCYSVNYYFAEDKIRMEVRKRSENYQHLVRHRNERFRESIVSDAGELNII